MSGQSHKENSSGLFSLRGFVGSMPRLVSNVWPGLWPLIVAITVGVYFANAPLRVMPVADFAVMHALIVVGLVATTIWLYNTFERPAVNMAVLGLWLLASAACLFASWVLRT